MFPRKTLLAGWRCIWKLFCLEQKVEMFKHITWNEHIWLIGWKVLAKLWWQRLASSEIPCFVLSPPATYTLHLFTLFLHLSSFSSQLYRTLAFSLQVSTSREPQFSSTVANFFRLRKPSDTFLPDNQHPTAVSQYSTTHRFLFSFHKGYPRILRDNQHPTAVSLYSATHRFLFKFYKGFWRILHDIKHPYPSILYNFIFEGSFFSKTFIIRANVLHIMISRYNFLVLLNVIRS